METTHLRDRLEQFGQQHLLRFEKELDEEQRRALYQQINAIDFERLARLFEESHTPVVDLDPNAVEPVPVHRLASAPHDIQRDRDAHEAGLQALRDGRVAAVLVAGGQGSRLGFEHPKGMYPIGPVRETPLFQIHAEKILAWSKRVGRTIPWYIMTSPTNRAETERFFAKHDNFGLAAGSVQFFEQGTMPAVDHETGKVLLAEKGALFTSPNGHGGSLTAMNDSGVLAAMAQQGIDLVYYFQVDNVKLKILDPVFLGHHLLQKAELSTKVVRKQHPNEKVGLVVHYDGLPTIIEYSDLPIELAEQYTDEGELRLWAGSIAIHVFDRGFLERLTGSDLGLPFHFAKKKVPYIDESGRLIEPSQPNALKFEMFVFDAMPQAKPVAVVETCRHEEYEPVKNAEGEHSPAEVRRAITVQAAKWLDHAGVEYPVNDEGHPAVDLEISPLAGLSAEDFAARLRQRDPIQQPTYFSKDHVE